MKLNRKWILVMSLVLSLAIATGSTLAYLMDTTETKTNVFTLGDVEITLTEDKWVNKSVLLPGKPVNKNPTITNTGWHDAWVWMDVVIPDALYDHLTLDNAPATNWKQMVTDNENGDKVVTLMYEKTLSSGSKVTPFETVTLKEGTTFAELKELGSTVSIDVTAYAIEAAEFTEVDKAYKVFNKITDDVANEDELRAALQAGGSVKLTQPITLTQPLTIGTNADIVIDLNQQTLSISADATDAVITNNGTLVLRNGTVDASNITADSNQAVDNNGVLTVENVTLLGPTSNFSYALRSKGTLDVKSATITAPFGGIGISGGEAVIRDGNYTATEGRGAHALYVSGESNVTIEGGTFTPYQGKAATSYALNFNSSSEKAEVVVKGGTFEANAWNNAVLKMGKGELRLEGGTYNGKVIYSGVTTGITLAGGTYSVAQPAGTCADGYQLTKTDDKWTVAKN